MNAGDYLSQQLQPLPREGRRLRVQPRHVSPGSCEARHESGLSSVSTKCHDDRDAAGGVLRCPDRGSPPGGEDHIKLEAYQLGGKGIQAIELSFRPPVLKGYAVAVAITEFL